MSVTFIHTADWQLGKGFGTVDDPQKRSLLQQERFNAVRRIGALAAERQAAFVLVAGDLFDSTTPTKATVSAACSAIGEIGVPVLVIPGNHDHGGPGSIWEQAYFQAEQARLAPNLVVLSAPQLYPCGGSLILPCPLLRRHDATDPLNWLRSAPALPDTAFDLPRIVVAHGTVLRFASGDGDDETEDQSANVLGVNRLDPEAFDYIALGDWHGKFEVAPKAWYPGTPELDRFPKGDGHQPGGVLVVTASRAQPPQVEWVPTARFGWHRVNFTFADDGGVEELERHVATLIGNRANEDLLRLDLDGTLGIEAAERLERLIDVWQARLLELRLRNNTTIAPSHAEIDALVARAGDPLIARVAGILVERCSRGDAPVERLALRQLHAACRAS